MITAAEQATDDRRPAVPLYVRAPWASGAVWRTDGEDGSGYAERPPGFLPL